MHLRNTFHIKENIIPDHFCNKIIKDGEKLTIKEGELSNNDVDGVGKNRNCKLSWITDEHLKKTFSYFVQSANKESDWYFSLKHFENLQYTIYYENDHYGWHIDSRSKPYDNGMIRKLSFTLCLNDEFEGGEFDICNPDPRETKNTIKSFKLKKGDMIVFPSHTWHRVNPVTKGTRKSLVGWALGPQWL